MTYEESHFCTDGCMYGEDECGRVLDEVIKALEKQIPKKPKKDRITFTNGSGYFDELCCPTCNNYLIQRDDYGDCIFGVQHDYCEECGQALDWGEGK